MAERGEIAASTTDAAKTQRNIEHAEEAYESTLHFLRSTEISELEKHELEKRVGRLQSLLKRLHERP